MHPNWRALATVDFPRKIFVKESEGTTEVAPKDERVWQVCPSNSGEEVRTFYEKVIKSAEEKRQEVPPKERPERPKRRQRKNPFNRNTFFRAAVNNDTKTILEMDFVANIEAVDGYGWTALMMAACEGAEDTVRMLLEAGASANASDAHGNSVESLAKKKGHHSILVAIHEALYRTGSFKGDDDTLEAPNSPHFCEVCSVEFKETSREDHETSTLHKFNSKSTISFQQRFPIPDSNRGCRIMMQQGWNKRDGLGPTGSGRIFPVKTVIRRGRSGIGIPQNEPRVTHFRPNDPAAVRRNMPRRRERTRRDLHRQLSREKAREVHFRHQLS